MIQRSVVFFERKTTAELSLAIDEFLRGAVCKTYLVNVSLAQCGTLIGAAVVYDFDAEELRRNASRFSSVSPNLV